MKPEKENVKIRIFVHIFVWNEKILFVFHKVCEGGHY